MPWRAATGAIVGSHVYGYTRQMSTLGLHGFGAISHASMRSHRRVNRLHGLDDEFWARMTAHYHQREIVELSMSIGSWLAFDQLNHVLLGLDAACVLPGR